MRLEGKNWTLYKRSYLSSVCSVKVILPHCCKLQDPEGPPVKGDPFYESQENHNLIGVANIFLEALFYDVKLDYHVPIISQQGEVSRK